MGKDVKTIQKNVSDGGGIIYAMGLIGAVFYYFLHATSFWEGFLGLLKAILWPAFLIYGLLDFLKL
jgi:hypothetical protein